jgi:hypothetical protein
MLELQEMAIKWKVKFPLRPTNDTNPEVSPKHV